MVVLVINNNLYVNIITYNRYIATTNKDIIVFFSDFIYLNLSFIL